MFFQGEPLYSPRLGYKVVTDPHLSGCDTLPVHAPIPSLPDILGAEVAEKVAAACRTTGIKYQTMKDRKSAFFLYRIARLFEA